MTMQVNITTRRSLRSWAELRSVEKAWLHEKHRLLFDAMQSERSKQVWRLYTESLDARLAVYETLVNGKRFEGLDTKALSALYLSNQAAFSQLQDEHRRIRRGELLLAPAHEQEWPPAIHALSHSASDAVALCQPRVPSGDKRDPVKHPPGSFWPMKWGQPPAEAYAHCEGYIPGMKRHDVRGNERPPASNPTTLPGRMPGKKPQNGGVGQVLMKKDRVNPSDLEPIKPFIQEQRRKQPPNVQLKHRNDRTAEQRADVTVQATPQCQS